MNRPSRLFLSLIALLVASCSPPIFTTPVVTTPVAATPAVATPIAGSPGPASQIANPASVYCEQQGYRLELRTDAAGNQAGVCIFPNGRECDEWAFFRGECGPAGAVSPTPAATLPPTATPAAGAATPGVGAVTYTSDRLGIRFSYLPEQNGQQIGVFEQGDKVYIYPASMAPTAGQYVQVFQKDPGESLAQAITRRIRPGHPAQDCQVVEQVERADSPTAAAGFEYAGIVVRRAEGEDESALLERWKTCPQPYTVIGGIGYFQADRNHPDRFLFLSIGQYGILAAPNQPWQDTLELY